MQNQRPRAAAPESCECAAALGGLVLDGAPSLPFKLETGVVAREAVGLIMFVSDQAIEHEFRTYEGSRWTFEVEARDEEDARVRVGRMAVSPLSF